jgi:hypothetical protein
MQIMTATYDLVCVVATPNDTISYAAKYAVIITRKGITIAINNAVVLISICIGAATYFISNARSYHAPGIEIVYRIILTGNYSIVLVIAAGVYVAVAPVHNAAEIPGYRVIAPIHYTIKCSRKTTNAGNAVNSV